MSPSTMVVDDYATIPKSRAASNRPSKERVSENLAEQRRSFGNVLRRPYEILMKRMYNEMANTGFPDIRPAHSAVFRHITPEGCRITDLAERAQMTKQSMAYLVDYLQEHGYATFIPDPTDGRAKLVCLTDRGVAVQEALIALGLRIEAALVHEIGSEEMSHLRELMQKVRAYLERDEPLP